MYFFFAKLSFNFNYNWSWEIKTFFQFIHQPGRPPSHLDAKFHKMGRYDQLRCKTCYNELWGNNVTSNLGVMPGLSLIANLPWNCSYLKDSQFFFCQSECFLQCTDKEYCFSTMYIINPLSISSLSWSPFTNPLRHKGCIHKKIIWELSKTSFWEVVKNEKVV